MASPSHLESSGGALPGWPLGPTLTRVLEQVEAKGLAMLQGLEGASRAFALARVWAARPRTTLVVAPSLAAAEELARDLAFFLPGEVDDPGPVALFPAYEVSPYQELEPPPEVTARRLAVLWRAMSAEEPLLVVASARAAGERLCPPEYLLDGSLLVEKGAVLERDVLVEALVRGGYSPVSLVEQPGEFAVRGSVVDFFGPLLEEPVRVELFGDEVESIRTFDPADQRSQLPITEATLIPCHPVDMGPEAAARALAGLKSLVEAEGLSSRRYSELAEKMDLRAPFPGLMGLMPLYYRQAADLFSYLSDGCPRVVVEPAEVLNRLRAQSETREREFEEAREEGRVVLAPPVLFRTPAQVEIRLKDGPRLLTRALSLTPGQDDEEGLVMERLSAAIHTGLHAELTQGGQGLVLGRFLEWVGRDRDKGRGVVLVCRSRSQAGRLVEILAERETAAQLLTDSAQAWPGVGREPEYLRLVVGGLSAGFSPEDAPVTFVTEDEVFGAPRVVRQKAPKRLSAMLAALDDLVPGDLVVHVDHGVGRYVGLRSMAVGPAESDFLELSYQGGDRLYLPADRMGLISKYRGPGEGAPPLDRLGGKAWVRTKGRVKKAVEEIAQDLVDLYAQRRVREGHTYDPPDSAFREFEASFPYSETPDQARAIAEVMDDLVSERPMDRLVCGDVGFGKTEVALRAAYLVASQGRQVAFLVPTTVLAEQHYQTFAERLENLPVLVESLSRFKTAAQQKKILKRLEEGKLDVVIGTHRLLSSDVVFKDLGLVVVDEEQRFGVRAKERLKELRKLVDVLTLTATPIPRTLQLSLSGIRDLSTINTPPEDRQSIKTYLTTFSPKAVKEAVERELRRGGQVFFVHNRVKDINRLARMVQDLVPLARVGVAHGQLSEKGLEKVMLAFVRRELDVLVATTIIESGLDIPNSNTIIINEADKLGLSQIYQLRGRVGRSSERAYAYLFIKSEASLTRDAKKRLKALMDFTQLGSGFAIAMHDLEIRGAGNLLGEAQSGMASDVGYELYLSMLEEAVARLKGEPPLEGPEPELNLAMAAQLPEEFVPDSQVRLTLYRRLSQARTGEDVEAVREELKDRFGPLPEAAENLLRAVGLKNALRRLMAERLDLTADGLSVTFSRESRVDVPGVLALAERDPQRLRVYPDGRVAVRLEPGAEPFSEALSFLQSVSANGI